MDNALILDKRQPIDPDYIRDIFLLRDAGLLLDDHLSATKAVFWMDGFVNDGREFTLTSMIDYYVIVMKDKVNKLPHTLIIELSVAAREIFGMLMKNHPTTAVEDIKSVIGILAQSIDFIGEEEFFYQYIGEEEMHKYIIET